MNGREGTVLRHGGYVRLAHLTFAILVGILIISGLGVGETLPAQIVGLLGGHETLANLHHLFGHALELVIALGAIYLLEGLQKLLADTAHFHRFEAAWPVAFLRFSLHPNKSVPPWHNGRFDPVQRLIFLLLGGSLALVVVTGLAFNFIPSSFRMLFAWNLRIHIAAAVALISVVVVHVVAGSGLISSHRGVARAMFGDGRVRVAVGRRLWPGWTARQVEVEGPAATSLSNGKLHGRAKHSEDDERDPAQ